MGTRLKKKLGSMGLDLSQEKILENFCLIGTPLPSLEKSRDAGEYLPAWKQEVRDEQGRRRLHGAFTGGFSAGYYNTVGSKEGWIPSTFLSSRSSRAGKLAAKPEDFMDEEDIADIKEGQKLVDTVEDEASGGQRHGATPGSDDIASSLQTLIPPVHDSAGARLLQRMGWRAGQGVGPRVTYARLKQQDAQSSAPPSELAPIPPVDINDEAAKHLFAPRDTKLTSFRPKDNPFGLGYAPHAGVGERPHDAWRGALDSNISAGFGLGALNDVDDDDIDIYDTGVSSSTQSRTAYDERLDADGQSSHKSSRPTGRPIPLTRNSLKTFHDGRQILPGFTMTVRDEIKDKWFPLPDVPATWIPNPQGIWNCLDVEHSETSTSNTLPSIGGGNKQIKLLASERGVLLGEPRNSGSSRSVFEYLSAKDKERLKGFQSQIRDRSGEPRLQPPPALPLGVPQPSAYVDAKVAQAALAGFQPFTNDPVKQSRYTQFLRSHLSPLTPPLQPFPGQIAEVFNKELEDYAKAALIFKPASAGIASRFVSSTLVETGPKVAEGLHKPDKIGREAGYLASSENNVVQRESLALPEDDKVGAARTGLYGPLTRVSIAWQPAKLLCKRFGMKEPNIPPEADSTQEPHFPPIQRTMLASQTLPSFSANQLPPSLSSTESSEPLPPQALSTIDRTNSTSIGLGEDDRQGMETLSYERPAIDLFKAIFASDEEDDEGDEPMGLEPSTSSDAKETGDSLDLVDVRTFKPTFVSRTAHEGSRKGSGTLVTDNEKVRKAKRKRAKGVLSFEVDTVFPTSQSKKQKREPRQDQTLKGTQTKQQLEPSVNTRDDMGDWVEKPAISSNTSEERTSPTKTTGASSGRKTASDFM